MFGLQMSWVISNGANGYKSELWDVIRATNGFICVGPIQMRWEEDYE